MRINKFVMPAVAAAVVLMGLPIRSEASYFSYSYAFGNGTTVSGTLEGSAVGSFVTNVSNVSLTINGSATGPTRVLSYWVVLGMTAGEPYQVSFDSSLNNFWFTSPDAFDSSGRLTSDGSYGFALIGSAVNTPYALRYGNSNAYVNHLATGLSPSTVPINATWSLVEIPEPATITLAGLALAGLCLGRRSKKIERRPD